MEALVDRGALDDLGQARRDQVVAQRDAVALGVLLDVGADGVEPGLHARIQLDVLALRDQVAAVDADVALLGLLVEQVHVGDERIGGVLLGQPIALGPERFRVGVDLGQEGIFLHRLGRERAVEIVDQGDGLLVELGRAGTTAVGAGLGRRPPRRRCRELRLPLLRSTMAPCSICCRRHCQPIRVTGGRRCHDGGRFAPTDHLSEGGYDADAWVRASGVWASRMQDNFGTRLRYAIGSGKARLTHALLASPWFPLTRYVPRGAICWYDISCFAGTRRLGAILDVGANVGQTAWGLVRYFPDATIYCFEPAAGPFAVLQSKYGSRGNVHCINAALGAAAEKRTLLVGADTELNTFVTDGPRGGRLTDHEVVEVDTVDRFCATRDIAQIDVLKMDVQGWECEILSGAARMIAGAQGPLCRIRGGLLKTRCRYGPLFRPPCGHGKERLSLLRALRQCPLGADKAVRGFRQRAVLPSSRCLGCHAGRQERRCPDPTGTGAAAGGAGRCRSRARGCPCGGS